MQRFALTIEFDGSPFQGLQRQKHGPSVQQAIEEAAYLVTGEISTLHSAGRTDSGVHARAMRSHLDLAKDIKPFRLMEALNAHLRPNPIAILACEIMPDDWHARFSCIKRSYCYRIINRRAQLTLEHNRAWHIPQTLNVAAMHRAAQALVGKHDFTTFRSAHCQAKSPVKSLEQIAVSSTNLSSGGGQIEVTCAARSFLHHQVRSMVGCLALVGMGRWPEERIAKVLAARNRQFLGLNAPAHGLYFIEAEYPC